MSEKEMSAEMRSALLEEKHRNHAPLRATLRDQFALAALPVFLKEAQEQTVSGDHNENFKLAVKIVCRGCYIVADAMLEEREKLQHVQLPASTPSRPPGEVR